MVKMRNLVKVGNQEVQRRYIGDKLIFENLGDKTGPLSGTEIYTDKADDSVVHVEVDGKSYQDGEPSPDYPIEIYSLNDFDVVSSVGGRNLIQNSNFSTGTTDGWGKESGLSNMRIVNDVFRSGGYSLLLQGNSSSARNYSNYIKAKEGEIFSLLYYAYLTGYAIYNSNYIEIVFLDSRQEIITAHQKRINELDNAPLNEWHQLKLENIKAPENTHYISAHLRWWGVSEDIYIDDIILVRDKSVSDWPPAPEDIAEDSNHPLIDKINFSLSEPLRSVGDVKDRLFKDSDGLWKVERNVGIINNITGYDSFTVSTISSGRPDLIRLSADSPSLGVVPGHRNAISSHVPTHTNPSFSSVTEESVDVNSNRRMIVIFLNSDRASTDAELINWMSNNNVEIQYIMEPRIENLPQSLQDKLNNLRSFQDSNYVYTIINDKTDILPTVAENLKPTLHTTFKSKGWYDYYQKTLLK